jgi:Protein of unknown function (DUF2877)
VSPHHPSPAAACATLAPLLTRAPRALEVVAATAAAVYLATGDPDVPALCLCTPQAVRVPCALVLGPGAGLPAVPVGARGLAGDGGLVLGELTARVARWWPPARPRRVAPAALPGSGPVPVPAATHDHDLVRGLLGWGEGLTPVGDDVLAGMLVTRTVLDPPAARRLAGLVDALAPARTTAVSAALLRHAGRGECVPELAALLDGVPGALDALLRVGHSSGAGLAQGVGLALAAAVPA